VNKKRKSEQRRPTRSPAGSTVDFEKLLQKAVAAERYSLCLYITGNSRRSARAISNIRALCDELLPGRYDLEVSSPGVERPLRRPQGTSLRGAR